MNCRTSRRKISAYLDDELSADETRELILHLLECGTCREELELLRTVDRELTRDMCSFQDAVSPHGIQMQIAAKRASRKPTTGLLEATVSLWWSLRHHLLELLGGECPATGSLEEFSDFPPLLMSHAYFHALSGEE